MSIKKSKKSTVKSFITDNNMLTFVNTIESIKNVKCEEVIDYSELDNMIKEVVEEVVEKSFLDTLIEEVENTTINNNVVLQQNVSVSKASLGRIIFEEELKNGLVRKNVIKRLMLEAGLTNNGAATYFQNMKKKAGLVQSRV